MQTIFNFEFRFDKNNKNKSGIVVSYQLSASKLVN
jgi:hypothetical protein